MKTRNWWDDAFQAQSCANKTFHWWGSDTPENSHWPGSDQLITYKFNEHGLRSGPLTHVPGKINILVSGCSHTMGVGLPYEHTWPRYLESMIENSVVHNLALGGGSGDYVARSLYVADQIVKADMFFVLWPEIHRFEYCQQSNRQCFTVHHREYPKIFLDETHMFNNYQKNLIFVKFLAGQRPFYHGTTDLVCALDTNSRARDGLHNCQKWNELLAEAFYIKYKEKDLIGKFSVAQDIIDYKAQYVDQKI